MTEIVKQETMGFMIHSNKINSQAVEKVNKYLPELEEKTRAFGSNNSQTEVGGAAYVKDSKGQNVGLSFLDTPNTTDQCTYKLYFNSRSGSYTTYLNRTHSNTNSSHFYVGGTTITAMEIAG